MPRLTTVFLTVIALLLMVACANMKAPSGGPKDIYSPQVEESDPPNYSLHFNSDKITLKFDEFVSVSDVAKEVFISPPFQKTPEIKTRGKSVIISIEEELHDSTTYSIFFGNAIKDITEGNPLENYTYVFSTGDKIDSLSVVGEILDAFALKPRDGVLVMLYEDANDTIPFDSLIYQVKPSYLTRSTLEGFFVINNIKEGVYDMLALADNNMSVTYDNADEEVAFLDSLITPRYLDASVKDSLFSDSLAIADSIPPDLPLEDFYSLFMFKEADSIQRLLAAEKPRNRVLRFIFRQSAEEINIEALTDVPDDWMLPEWNKTFDTLRYYIMDDDLDTISLKISMDTTVFDTVSYSLVERELPQRKKEQKEAQILKVVSPRGNPFPHHHEYIIATAYPFIDYDFNRILLVEGEDTLQPELAIEGEARRKIKLIHPLKENTDYQLFIPDSVLTDLLGRSNDTVISRFTTDEEKDYGKYSIHTVNESPYSQLVVQLLTEDEKVMREEIVLTDEIISWDYLRPGKYILKVFGDLNQNGLWDTGSLHKRQQAEPVVFYPELVEVRAAWSFDLEWLIRFE